MTKRLLFVFVAGLIISMAFSLHAKAGSDVIETSEGPLKITLFGHASLMLQFKDQVVHVDPFSKMADYSKQPKADLILITHQHGDHLDPAAMEKIAKDDTLIISTPLVCKQLKRGRAMKNGDTHNASGMEIQAVPAYNIKHKRSNGQPYHPRGIGNGYTLAIGDKRIYVAGDTENIPEMKELEDIDIAFLPINLPYTMDAGMFAEAVKTFRPKIVYPYHYDLGKSDLANLDKAMSGVDDVEVRAAKGK